MTLQSIRKVFKDHNESFTFQTYTAQPDGDISLISIPKCKCVNALIEEGYKPIDFENDYVKLKIK